MQLILYIKFSNITTYYFYINTSRCLNPIVLILGEFFHIFPYMHSYHMWILKILNGVFPVLITLVHFFSTYSHLSVLYWLGPPMLNKNGNRAHPYPKRKGNVWIFYHWTGTFNLGLCTVRILDQFRKVCFHSVLSKRFYWTPFEFNNKHLTAENFFFHQSILVIYSLIS